MVTDECSAHSHLAQSGLAASAARAFAERASHRAISHPAHSHRAHSQSSRIRTAQPDLASAGRHPHFTDAGGAARNGRHARRRDCGSVHGGQRGRGGPWTGGGGCCVVLVVKSRTAPTRIFHVTVLGRRGDGTATRVVVPPQALSLFVPVRLRRKLFPLFRGRAAQCG